MKNGISLLKRKSLKELRENAMDELSKLPLQHKLLDAALPYPTGFGHELLSLQKELITKIKSQKIKQ
jgi:hypothetical protein